MAWKEMTEAEWLMSRDGLTMGQQDVPYSSRKSLLIVAACLRRSEPLPWLLPSKVNAADAERLADGLASGFDPIKERVGHGMGNGEPGIVIVNVSPEPNIEQLRGCSNCEHSFSMTAG